MLVLNPVFHPLQIDQPHLHHLLTLSVVSVSFAERAGRLALHWNCLQQLGTRPGLTGLTEALASPIASRLKGKAAAPWVAGSRFPAAAQKAEQQNPAGQASRQILTNGKTRDRKKTT